MRASLVILVLLLLVVISLMVFFTFKRVSLNKKTPTNPTKKKNDAVANQPAGGVVKHDTTTSANEKANYYVQLAMKYYTGKGDLAEASAIFDGKVFKKKNQVTREAFERARELDPTNIDVLYSLASLAVLRRDIKEALQFYDAMLTVNPSSFKAQLMKTIYSKVNGEEKAYEKSRQRLVELDKEKANHYLKKIAYVDQLKKVPFTKEVPVNLPQTSHGFIILGYALSKEGNIKHTLLERLQIGLKAAETYPHSTIIVTGGVPKNGITESDAMLEWLVGQGVAKERIVKENKSTDTIQNALETMKLVDELNLHEVTLVTNAKHMRRVMALFTEANQLAQESKKIPTRRKISQLVYDDYKKETDETMSKAEEIVIYRDLIRTSGIWQFPNLFQ